MRSSRPAAGGRYRRRRRDWWAALSILLLAVAGCGKERPPLAPGPPVGDDRPRLLMAFVSERPPSEAFVGDIWFYDVARDSAWLPRNLNTPNLEGPCGLAADGRTLAFYTIRSLVGTIGTGFLYDIRTGELRIPRAINTLFNVLNPALSGDGRYMTANYQIGGPYEQFITVSDVVADTLLPVPNINDPNATNFAPYMSGDGTLVALSANGARSRGGFDVLLYSIPGDSLIPLPGLNSTADDLAVSLSADARLVAFQSGRLGGAGLTDVFLYDRATSSLVPLTGVNTAFSELHPALSPDGRYLAYTTEGEGGTDVRLYDILEQRLIEIPGANDPYYPDRFPELTVVAPAAVPVAFRSSR
jgi:WD40 repeat protein